MDNGPILTEPGVRYFLSGILRQCREKKYKIYSRIFNITLFCMFLLALGGFLYYRYKGKMTEEEKKSRVKEEEIYISSKIRELQQKSARKQNLIITDIPQLDSGFDVLHKNYYSV